MSAPDAVPATSAAVALCRTRPSSGLPPEANRHLIKLNARRHPPRSWLCTWLAGNLLRISEIGKILPTSAGRRQQIKVGAPNPY
jgi:hypothetical protein